MRGVDGVVHVLLSLMGPKPLVVRLRESSQHAECSRHDLPAVQPESCTKGQLAGACHRSCRGVASLCREGAGKKSLSSVSSGLLAWCISWLVAALSVSHVAQ